MKQRLGKVEVVWAPGDGPSPIGVQGPSPGGGLGRSAQKPKSTT